MRTYTREEAVVWMTNGHKARPPTWDVGHIRTHFGRYRDESMNHVDVVIVLEDRKWATGWQLLGKARMDREAKLRAALAAVIELQNELAKARELITVHHLDNVAHQDEVRRQRKQIDLREERISAIEDALPELGSVPNAALRAHCLSIAANITRLEGELHALRQSLKVADTSDRLNCATIARLEGELATAKVASPRFRVGQKVVIKGGSVAVAVVRHALRAYRVQGSAFLYDECDLTPAHEAPAVPVEATRETYRLALVAITSLTVPDTDGVHEFACNALRHEHGKLAAK